MTRPVRSDAWEPAADIGPDDVPPPDPRNPLADDVAPLLYGAGGEPIPRRAPLPSTGLVLGARPIGADELAAPLPPIDWISRDLQWGPGRPNMLIGYSGSAKSLATLAAAVALAAGRPIWGQLRAGRRRVLVLTTDSGKRAVMGRLQRLARGLGVDAADLIRAGYLCVVPHPKILLTRPGAADHYRRAFDGWGLCILDALRGFLPGVDEKDSRIREYLDPLTEASDETGCASLLLHHEAKGGAPSGGKGGRATRPDDEAARGSAGIIDAAGAIYRIVREEHEGRDVYAVRIAKPPEEPPGPKPEPFYLTIDDVADEDVRDLRWGLRVVYRTAEQIQGPPPKPGDKLAAVKARLLSYIREETRAGRPVPGKAAAAAALEIGDRAAAAAVEALLAEGRIEDRPEKAGRGLAKSRLWAVGSVGEEQGE